MCPREASVTLAAWSCVLLAVVSTASEIEIYKKEGDTVVLKPGDASVNVAGLNIVWKHNQNIAMDFDGTAIDHYRQFEGHGSLNLTNGEMTITGLTRNFSGLYTSEIPGIRRSALRLIVISPVPKPTVGKSCDEEGGSCTLTCDGDAADAGPVTYRWRRDDEWTSGSQSLHITKDGTLGVKEFSCELENPVSRESSQPVTNPLAPTPEGKVNISMGVTVFIALLVAVLLLVGVHRCKAGMWFFQKNSMPWEANFWRKNEQQSYITGTAIYAANGTSDREKGNNEEETALS